MTDYMLNPQESDNEDEIEIGAIMRLTADPVPIAHADSIRNQSDNDDEIDSEGETDSSSIRLIADSLAVIAPPIPPRRDQFHLPEFDQWLLDYLSASSQRVIGAQVGKDYAQDKGKTLRTYFGENNVKLTLNQYVKEYLSDSIEIDGEIHFFYKFKRPTSARI